MSRHLSHVNKQERKAVNFFGGCALVCLTPVTIVFGTFVGPLVATILDGAIWYQDAGGLTAEYDDGFGIIPYLVGLVTFALCALTVGVYIKTNTPKPTQNPDYRTLPTLDGEVSEVPSVLAQSPPQLLIYFQSRDLEEPENAPLRPYFLSLLFTTLALLASALYAYHDPTELLGEPLSLHRLLLLAIATLPGIGYWLWQVKKILQTHVPNRRLLIDRRRQTIEVVDLALSRSTPSSHMFPLSEISSVGLSRSYEKGQLRFCQLQLNRVSSQHPFVLFGSGEESTDQKAAQALSDYLGRELIAENTDIPDWEYTRPGTYWKKRL